MDIIPTNRIVCPHCAGENEIPVDEKFVECAFCGSSIYVDKSKIVNHFVVMHNFTPEQAEGNLRRWMAGNFQVKDLDKLAKIDSYKFYYFPMWYFKVIEGSKEMIFLQPATNTSIFEIKNFVIPAGSLKPYNKSLFKQSEFINPDVQYDSAKSWLSQSNVNLSNLAESNLVHIPFYQFFYSYNGSQYTAMVEASSGKVYANVWPQKKEAPFYSLFIISIILYLLMTFISYALLEKGDSLILGEIIKIFTYGLISIPLLIIAYFIAKKV